MFGIKDTQESIDKLEIKVAELLKLPMNELAIEYSSVLTAVFALAIRNNMDPVEYLDRSHAIIRDRLYGLYKMINKDVSVRAPNASNN